MNWHWQNLSKEYKKDANWPRSGRAWFHISNNCLGVEWVIFSRRMGLSIEFSTTDDHNVLLVIQIPFILALYISLDRLPIVKKLPGVKWKNGDYYSGHREISLTLHDWAVWWRIWRHPHISDSRDKRDGCFHIDNFLLGRARYFESQRIRRNKSISLPEGDYPIVIEIYDAIWLRPRWPFPRTIRRANIEIEKGIPTPGGDSDYAPDEDATYGFTCVARTDEEAIRFLRESIMRDREGDVTWQPKAGWPEHCIRRPA